MTSFPYWGHSHLIYYLPCMPWLCAVFRETKHLREGEEASTTCWALSPSKHHARSFIYVFFSFQNTAETKGGEPFWDRKTKYMRENLGSRLMDYGAGTCTRHLTYKPLLPGDMDTIWHKQPSGWRRSTGLFLAPEGRGGTVSWHYLLIRVKQEKYTAKSQLQTLPVSLELLWCWGRDWRVHPSRWSSGGTAWQFMGGGPSCTDQR